MSSVLIDFPFGMLISAVLAAAWPYTVGVIVCLIVAAVYLPARPIWKVAILLLAACLIANLYYWYAVAE